MQEGVPPPEDDGRGTEAPRLKVPPHDIDSEKSVLGGCMVDADAYKRVEHLTPEHFYRVQHRVLWAAFEEMAQAGTALDVVTVAGFLEARGLDAKVGGKAALADILESTLSAANVHHYAAHVTRLHHARRNIHFANRLAEAAFGDDEQGMHTARLALADVPVGVGQAAQTMEGIEMQGTDWLWHHWLPRGFVTLFAAPGGSGKGTFWAYIAACMTNRRPWPDGRVTEPEPVAIFSPEDDLETELVPRLRLAGADMALCHHLEEIDPYGANVPPGIGLVIIDPVATGFGGDGNLVTDVRPFMMRWNELARRTGAGVLAVHHIGKWASSKLGAAARDLPIGSTAWVDVARWLIMLARDRGDEEGGSRILIRAKGNIGGVDYTQGAWRIYASAGGLGTDSSDRPIQNAAVSQVVHVDGDADTLFFEAITPPQSREESVDDNENARMILEAIRDRNNATTQALLSEDTGMHRNTVRKWVNRLISAKRIRMRKPTGEEIDAGIPRNVKVIYEDEAP